MGVVRKVLNVQDSGLLTLNEGIGFDGPWIMSNLGGNDNVASIALPLVFSDVVGSKIELFWFHSELSLVRSLLR